jgi:intracellular septation protein
MTPSSPGHPWLHTGIASASVVRQQFKDVFPRAAPCYRVGCCWYLGAVMDKRLLLELAPGPAFLIGNAIGGIFAGAMLASIATGIAIVLRWRWDRSLPWLAISIFTLTIVLLTIGLVLDDTTYVKVSNTIGSVLFAAIIGIGMFLRPSLLQRTFGDTIHMTARGWHILHIGWISLSLARAALNEVVWRNASDQSWAIYNGVSDIVWIGAFFILTSFLAHQYWDELGH